MPSRVNPVGQLTMPFLPDMEDDGGVSEHARMVHAVQDLTIPQLRKLSRDSRKAGVKLQVQWVVDEALTAAVMAEPKDYEVEDGLNEHGVFENPCEALTLLSGGIRIVIQVARSRFGHVADWTMEFQPHSSMGGLPKLNDQAFPQKAGAVVASLDDLSAYLDTNYAQHVDEPTQRLAAASQALIAQHRQLIRCGLLTLPAVSGTAKPAREKGRAAKPIPARPKRARKAA